MRGVTVLAAVLLLTGCATVPGSPIAATSDAELFEPCDIPEDVLRAADVDPVNVGSDFLGEDDEDWDICTWAGSWYFLTVLSTTHSFGEIKTNPRSVDFVDVDVGERNAVTYQSTLFPGGVLCDVAFPWQRGSVVVRIDKKLSQPLMGDTCVIALNASNVLDPALPR